MDALLSPSSFPAYFGPLLVASSCAFVSLVRLVWFGSFFHQN